MNKLYILYGFLISFCFITIGSTSSFLYPFNDWVDINAYFTVGKGLIHGLVPYRDLFDHKGPYTYFLFAFVYLISNNSFLGLYFVELIAFTVFLCVMFKIITLYTSQHVAFILLPILSALIVCNDAFSFGGNLEELTLPFLTYSLYSMLKMFKYDTVNNGNIKIFIVNGIIAGIILWTKFSFLGFWFGWMSCIFILQIINKKFRTAFMSCIYFLLGMIVASIPVFIYFFANHSVNDLLNVYFTINLTYYSSEASLLYRFYLILRELLYYPSYERSINIYGIFILAGLFIFIKSNQLIEHLLHRWVLIAIFLFLTISLYISGVLRIYYFLLLLPFSVFFLIGIAYYCPKINQLAKSSIITLTFCFCFFCTIIYGNNSSFILKKKENMVQFKFAEIINKEKNPTLLNYLFLDGGFYTAANLVPQFKYFYLSNIHEFSDNLDEQRMYIREKMPLFVVVRIPEEKDDINDYYLHSNYKVVATEYQMNDKLMFKYLLYRLKDE